MKALGMVRKIDSLGRVVIPMEFRREFSWETGTPVEMLASDQGLLLRPYKASIEREVLLSEIKNALDVTDNPAVVEILNNAMAYIKKQ